MFGIVIVVVVVGVVVVGTISWPIVADGTQ
jgi:hypothetical protein